MNDRTEGLKELNLAANCNPSFVEQFVIFRQMKSTDDVGTSSSEDKNMDVISKYAFESTVRQFREEIKKAAEFH